MPSRCSTRLAHHRGRRSPRRSDGSRADPVHAGVDLHVDGHGPARRPGRCREGLDRLDGVQGRCEPVGQRGVDGVGAALAQQQHGRRDAVLAQLDPLVDQRDGEALRAPGHGGPGHGRPAVAVAVGLDHRAQLGRRGQAGQHRRVVGHGRQVDLRPGRPRAPLRHGHLGVLVRRDRGHQPHRRALSHRRSPAAGSGCPSPGARPASRGPRPPGPAGRPPPGLRADPSDRRPPVHVGRERRRLRRRESAGQKGADDPRQHVAAAGGGEDRAPGRAQQHVGRRRRPAGPRRSADPFTRTTAPVASASRRAAARRSSPGGGAGDPGVLPVVGREDARRAALLEQGARRGGVTQRA